MAKDPVIKIRSAYSPRLRVVAVTGEKSMAQQNMKDECDVNNILAKYQKTGLISHLNDNAGSYDNFTGYQDYHSSMNQVLEAQASFLMLPSSIRKKFANDPAQFMEFVRDPENAKELVEMGLANEIVAPEVLTPPSEGTTTSEASSAPQEAGVEASESPV